MVIARLKRHCQKGEGFPGEVGKTGSRVRHFSSSRFAPPASRVLAAMIVATIVKRPLVDVVRVLQKRGIDGLTEGAVKR